jgi:hypothetical protein
MNQQQRFPSGPLQAPTTYTLTWRKLPFQNKLELKVTQEGTIMEVKWTHVLQRAEWSMRDVGQGVLAHLRIPGNKIPDEARILMEPWAKSEF